MEKTFETESLTSLNLSRQGWGFTISKSLLLEDLYWQLEGMAASSEPRLMPIWWSAAKRVHISKASSAITDCIDFRLDLLPAACVL